MTLIFTTKRKIKCGVFLTMFLTGVLTLLELPGTLFVSLGVTVLV